MSDPPQWQARRMNGEEWLSAKLSIAPRRFAAFSITWFRVEAAGPIPDWLLLLGAMGLHVFGEGDEIVVQDRPGSSPEHDAARLRILRRFVEEDVGDGPLALTRTLSFEGPDASLTERVRGNLRAGYWDLPARQGFPGVGASAQPSRMARRRGVHGGRGRLPRRPISKARMYTARAGVGLSLLAAMGGIILLEENAPYVGKFLALAWGMLMTFVLMWCAAAGTDPNVSMQPLFGAPAPSRSFDAEALPHDARPLFVQLHDALTSEGYACLEHQRDLSGAEKWEAHMAMLLSEYHRLMEPPPASEETCTSAT